MILKALIQITAVWNFFVHDHIFHLTFGKVESFQSFDYRSITNRPLLDGNPSQIQLLKAKPIQNLKQDDAGILALW